MAARSKQGHNGCRRIYDLPNFAKEEKEYPHDDGLIGVGIVSNVSEKQIAKHAADKNPGNDGQYVDNRPEGDRSNDFRNEKPKGDNRKEQSEDFIVVMFNKPKEFHMCISCMKTCP